jgi:hypothetical protein
MNHTGKIVHGFTVFVHSKINPSTEEWQATCQLLSSAGGQLKGSLVYTEGGSPSATQRKQLRDAYQRHTALPTAVMTESIVARTAITALNLFMTEKILPFPPSEIDNALRAIGAPEADWPDIKKALKELQGLLTPSSK